MARKHRSSPPSISQPLPNDVVEEDDAATSESDKSSPKPSRERPCVKRILTLDGTHKSGSKPDPKPSRKRASENEKGGVKKARVENETVEKGSVNRVWSEEDELVVLQGMIDYRLDPHSDFKAFLEFVKHSLHVDNVSVKQLRDKVRRLRDKYLAKAVKGDDDVVFVKPHDHKLFQLSEKVWGGGNADTQTGNAVVNDKDEDVVIEDEVENGAEEEEEENEGLDFKGMYPNLSEALESDVCFPQQLKDFSVRLIASEKMRALDKEWKEVFVKDLQFYLNKLDLKTKFAKVVLDQMISSDP